MPNTNPIQMDSLKLANDVLARESKPDGTDAEVRKLAQALIEANNTITTLQSSNTMQQKE